MLVTQYEEPRRQEAARVTVPVDKLEEKALIALARVRAPDFYLHVCIFQEKGKKKPWQSLQLSFFFSHL